MDFARIKDIEGQVFPAGRHTRVLVGETAPIKAEGFCMGHVNIFPGGQVPAHRHPQEEVYYVVNGEGEIDLEGELQPIKKGEAVYVPPNQIHNLRNPGKQDMTFVFVYAPAGVVDHWEEEMKGKL